MKELIEKLNKIIEVLEKKCNFDSGNLAFVNDFSKECRPAIPPMPAVFRRSMLEYAAKYDQLSDTDKAEADKLLKEHKCYKNMMKWVGELNRS